MCVRWVALIPDPADLWPFCKAEACLCFLWLRTHCLGSVSPGSPERDGSLWPPVRVLRGSNPPKGATRVPRDQTWQTNARRSWVSAHSNTIISLMWCMAYLQRCLGFVRNPAQQSCVCLIKMCQICKLWKCFYYFKQVFSILTYLKVEFIYLIKKLNFQHHCSSPQCYICQLAAFICSKIQ